MSYRIFSIAVAMGLWAAPVDLQAQPSSASQVSALRIWTRAPGATGDEEPEKVQLLAVADMPRETFERTDPQYGKSYKFRGFGLTALIARLRVADNLDLALLHFGNGMVIPLPFRDGEAMTRLAPMVARELLVGTKAAPLPPVVRKARDFVDVPAIEFSGNKVVVAAAWHPMTRADEPEFSPWRHADSLVGIEFVDGAAYYKQFDVDPALDAHAGFEFFKQTCQFCHGTRKIGASLGWDFVEPVPLYTWRASAKRLYWHVAFRRLDAPEQNLMMPAIKHMTEADAGKVFKWLEAVGKKPLRPYAPRALAK